MKTENVYLVWLKSQKDISGENRSGYYAAKQPNYEWSLTDDIYKAKHYKTFFHALERLKFTGLDNGEIKEFKLEKIIRLSESKTFKEDELIEFCMSKHMDK